MRINVILPENRVPAEHVAADCCTTVFIYFHVNVSESTGVV